MSNSNLCDKCLLNPYCDMLNAEGCHALCVDEESPVYKVFLMGYEAGYNDCELEYNDELAELKDALDEFDEEDEEEMED